MIKENIPVTKDNPPSKLLPWLTHTDVLTAKLYELSKNTSIKVLKQGFSSCNWWDKYVLKVKSTNVFHREVLIMAWVNPCWYARTIIPETTYVKHKKLFLMLKNKTLGDLIFSDNGIMRSYLKYYTIDKNSIEYHWLESSVISSQKKLWVRISKFNIQNDAFYLFEVFLPGLEKYIC